MKPNSEDLVERCYASRSKIIHFVRAPKNGELDTQGIDFIVGWNGHGLEIRLQIKTSNTGQTMGIFITTPVIDEKIVPVKMLGTVREHCRKYPLVRHMLFVARPGRRKSEEEIDGEIWNETTRNLLPKVGDYGSVG